MLRIRFTRRGKRNHATYRVVVIERHRATDGKFVEDLGSYDPHSRDFRLNHERFDYWKSKGAQPTDSVVHLFASCEGKEEGKRPRRTGFTKKNKRAKVAEEAVKEAKKAEEAK